MICKTMSECVSKIISASDFNINVELWRSLGGTSIKTIIERKDFERIFSQKMHINEQLEITFKDINYVFKDHTIFFCVFYNIDLDLVVIPEWCKEIMIGTKGSSFKLHNHISVLNTDFSHTIVKPIIELNKFDIIQ